MAAQKKCSHFFSAVRSSSSHAPYPAFVGATASATQLHFASIISPTAHPFSLILLHSFAKKAHSFRFIRLHYFALWLHFFRYIPAVLRLPPLIIWRLLFRPAITVGFLPKKGRSVIKSRFALQKSRAAFYFFRAVARCHPFTVCVVPPCLFPVWRGCSIAATPPLRSSKKEKCFLCI
jgi:hypothetical protein